MPCFVFVAGFPPANRLKAMRTTGVKSELATLRKVWRKLAVMKIPYFIASVLLTGNHLNTDYLLGRQLMHISKKQLDRQREKTLQILDRIFSATLFLALQVISFRGHRHKDLMTTFGNSGNCLEIKLIARHDPVMAPIWPARNLGASTLPHRFRMRSSIP